MGLRNEGWRAWIPAVAALVTIPFAILAYTANATHWALIAYVIPAIIGGAYIGPGFAIIQSQIGVEMRSVAAAINLFISNIIGLGIGPFAVGVVSDYFEPTQGIDSLRYGLLATMFILLWGAFHYWRAGRLLQRAPLVVAQHKPA